MSLRNFCGFRKLHPFSGGLCQRQLDLIQLDWLLLWQLGLQPAKSTASSSIAWYSGKWSSIFKTMLSQLFSWLFFLLPWTCLAPSPAPHSQVLPHAHSLFIPLHTHVPNIHFHEMNCWKDLRNKVSKLRLGEEISHYKSTATVWYRLTALSGLIFEVLRMMNKRGVQDSDTKSHIKVKAINLTWFQ